MNELNSEKISSNAKSELEIYKIIENENIVSQFKISKKIGIAVGLVNFIMKRAFKKGLLKVKKVPARRYSYFLTPKGFTEKASLVAKYINNSLSFFRKIRFEFSDVFRELSDKNYKEIILIGDMELIEIAMISSLENDVLIKAIICNSTNKKYLGEIPIYNGISSEEINKILNKNNSCIVIAGSLKPQEIYDKLISEMPNIIIRAPQSLFVNFRENKL